MGVGGTHLDSHALFYCPLIKLLKIQSSDSIVLAEI